MHQRYSTDECLACFTNKLNNADFIRLIWDDDPLCADCRNRLKPVKKIINVDGIECETLYLYEENLKQLLLQYKELNDEALYPVFIYPYIKYIEKKYKNYTMVFVPSTLENIEKRGFNHLEKMFSIVNLAKADLFYKTNGKDQKSSDYYDRQKVNKHIHLKKNINIENKKILLVDDVITTGASIKACYKLLKNKNAEVKVLTMSCNYRYL